MTSDNLADDLIKKLEAQKILILQLDMWAKVKAQGIDPETVDVFGFDPLLMTDEERKEAREQVRKESKRQGVIINPTSSNPFHWPIFKENGKEVIRGLKHNFVRLKTGEKVKLTPMIDRPPSLPEFP